MDYIKAKTLVTNNKNTYWFGSEYNMNIYRGCSHGCIYCDSRSECYKIETFENILAKKDAIKIIDTDLRRKKVRGVVVCTGSMSDPYNPKEADTEFTREALKIIDKHKFGVSIATKSPLVIRDVDILTNIKKHSPVIVEITITTSSDKLAKKIEPNVASSTDRFTAINELRKNNIYAGVLMMPILPMINDNKENVCDIVLKSSESKAKFIFPSFGLTLRDRQREYYYKKVEELFGKSIVEKYKETYGNKYACNSLDKTLYYKFREECKIHNILYTMKDIIADYKNGYKKEEQYFLQLLKD